MTMRLALAALKVHLAHVANLPVLGSRMGLTFTSNGIPGLATVPGRHQEERSRS